MIALVCKLTLILSHCRHIPDSNPYRQGDFKTFRKKLLLKTFIAYS